MHNLFFLGIILVGKEKIQNKKAKQYKNKKKVQSITFCCGDCRNKRGCELVELGAGEEMHHPRASLQGCFRKNHKRKIKRLAGTPTSASSEKEMGWGVFQVFSAVKNSEKQKLITTHAVSSSPKTMSAKCVQEPQRF